MQCVVGSLRRLVASIADDNRRAIVVAVFVGRCISWGRCPQMVRLSLTRLAAAVGSLTIALTAGVGVASADPMDAIINTTCNFGQVMAALNATDPGAAAQFNSSPMAQGYLR